MLIDGKILDYNYYLYSFRNLYVCHNVMLFSSISLVKGYLIIVCVKS